MRLSIVIPVLNSERTLGECLEAIAAQTLPRGEYEIVLADAGSADRTLEIARAAGVDRIYKIGGAQAVAALAKGQQVSSLLGGLGGLAGAFKKA